MISQWVQNDSSETVTAPGFSHSARKTAISVWPCEPRGTVRKRLKRRRDPGERGRFAVETARSYEILPEQVPVPTRLPIPSSPESQARKAPRYATPGSLRATMEDPTTETDETARYPMGIEWRRLSLRKSSLATGWRGRFEAVQRIGPGASSRPAASTRFFAAKMAHRPPYRFKRVIPNFFKRPSGCSRPV